MTDAPRYSLTQARSMLGGIDQKTLKDWLQKAKVTPAADAIDKRFRYVTRADIEKMAAQHGREVQEPAARKRVTLSDALARIEELESEVTTLKSAPKRANASGTHYDGQEGVLGMLADRSHTAAARETQSGPLNAAVVSQEPATRSHPVQRKTTKASDVGLPEGLISLQDACMRYHWSRTTIMSAINARKIPCTHGNWPVGKVTIQWAFTAEQLAATLDVFPDRSGKGISMLRDNAQPLPQPRLEDRQTGDNSEDDTETDAR